MLQEKKKKIFHTILKFLSNASELHFEEIRFLYCPSIGFISPFFPSNRLARGFLPKQGELFKCWSWHVIVEGGDTLVNWFLKLTQTQQSKLLMCSVHKIYSTYREIHSDIKTTNRKIIANCDESTLNRTRKKMCTACQLGDRHLFGRELVDFKLAFSPVSLNRRAPVLWTRHCTAQRTTAACCRVRLAPEWRTER